MDEFSFLERFGQLRSQRFSWGSNWLIGIKLACVKQARARHGEVDYNGNDGKFWFSGRVLRCVASEWFGELFHMGFDGYLVADRKQWKGQVPVKVKEANFEM